MLRRVTAISLVFVLYAFTFVIAQDQHHGQIDIKCDACHLTKGWDSLKLVLDFDHQTQTAYPLEGQHRTAGCTECHTSLVFSEAGSECISCHEDIHEGQFANACSECHTPETWQNETEMAIRHSQTRYPLVGVHANLDCQVCHTSGQYVNLPLNCDGCHSQQFFSTTNPDHQAAQFSTNCTECHNANSRTWDQVSYKHTESFQLISSHRISDCVACHAGQTSYADAETGCVSCHEQDFNESTNPDHAAGNFSSSCDECHTIDGWQPAEFDHNLSDYPLTGAHIEVECLSCHIDAQYTGISSECFPCHTDDYNESTEPNHLIGEFDQVCESCHTTDGWTPSLFDHDIQTEYALDGGHVEVACIECHIDNMYKDTPSECYYCHDSDYNETEEPNHKLAQMSQLCEECHTTTQWEPSTFSHDKTAFQLIGAHQKVNCQECHIDGQFASTSTECIGCHEDDYESVSNPNHRNGQFNENCLICHTMTAWRPSTHDHDLTEFPLTGAHVTASCEECHSDGQYAGRSTDCFACHDDDFAGADNPNHADGEFDHDCTECHSTIGWSPAAFDHDTYTDFPLIGAHKTANCAECHTDEKYVDTSSECYSCHQNDFEGADNPNHAEAELDHNCAMCHSTEAWSPATFNHDENTDFPLTGAHLTVSCEECHIDGLYNNASSDCFACHDDDYEEVDDPNHLEGQFDHNCAICHSDAAWTPATMDHDNTDFPLRGAHITVNCGECHINGQFEGTSSECFWCHDDDYEEVDNPNHLRGQFDHNCAICHSVEAWSPATFDHDEKSDFPLTGAHITVSCEECHIDGQYNDTPSECFFCHDNDFEDADNPNHVDGEFDHDCTICHSDEAWSPADFDHDQTDFPLTGRHVRVDCAECHVDGNFNNLLSECFACHEDDYNNAEYRGSTHRGAGFPIDCEQCHTTNSWDNAQFDHDGEYFPIFTGRHREEWNNCAECHPDGNNFDIFSCLDCHEHRQAEMDRKHDEVRNYRYESEACLACHPDGREDDFGPAQRPERKID